MIAVDTSVAVAAFGDWHELNGAATAVLDDGATIPSHALLETFAVLTGFPPPYRAAPALVHEWLVDRFPKVLPPPSPGDHRDLIGVLAREGRPGGAVYDAIVGLTARSAGATLVTADVRARPVYDLVGAEVRPLA